MKTKCIFLLALIGFTSVSIFAQINPYNTDLIPQQLKAYANVVVRNQEQTVEVKELDHVVYKEKKTMTILNSKGENYGHIYVFYDKSRQIKKLKAAIYDASGNLIKKIKESDFEDISAISDFSLFEDNRVKRYVPLVNYYPYTIEYEYEIKIKNSLHFPKWIPQSSHDISAEKSRYRFISRIDYPTRINENNLTTPKKETIEGELKIYEWTAQNLEALKSEPYSPPAEDFLTIVEIAPVKFMYEGISGEFSNWQEYGKWMYDNLLKGRDELSPANANKVLQLIEDTDLQKEKVKKIYEYMQNKTRYISVQIGIGGLQPMKAEEVDRIGYGDCKALTNYTKALLKAAGIHSIYTEVYGGSSKKSYSADFASLQGNHVILCVPLNKDTVWLECTNRNAPFGYLGTFTDDRNVLLCTENGGIITKTRTYPAKENQQIRTASFSIDSIGNLEGSMETVFEGIQYVNRNEILDKSPKDRRYALKEIYPINNLEITKYDLTQDKSEKPVTVEKIELRAKQYGSVNANRIFVPLNNFNRIERIKDVRNRKNKVFINRGFYDEDIISYVLPEDFTLEFGPPSVEVKNEFGSFHSKVAIEGNKLIYTRKLIINSGENAAEMYEELVEFIKQVSENDNSKFVLIKG